MHFLLLSTLFIFFIPSAVADINNTSQGSQTISAEQASLPEKTALEMNGQTGAVELLTSAGEDSGEAHLIQPAQTPLLQSEQHVDSSVDLVKQLEMLREELNEVKTRIQTTADTNNVWQFRESVRISDKEIVIDNTILAILIALLGLLVALFAVFLAQRAKNRAVYEAKKTAEMHFLMWLEEKESEIVENLVERTTAINKIYGEEYLTDLDQRLFTAQKTAKDLRHLSDLYLSITTQYEDDIRVKLAQFDQASAADDIRKFTNNVNNRLAHKIEADYSTADSFDKAILSFHQQAYPTAIAFLNKVITDPNSSDLLVTNALFNKAYSLQKLQQTAQAISIYDELILRVAENDPIDLQQQVIKSLLQKAFLLKQLNQFDQEIAVYEKIVSRFSGFTNLFFERQVNLAFMQKALALAEKGPNSDVLAIYDDLIARLEERTELEMQRIVAKALLHKSNYLAKIGQQQASLICYESVVSRFAQSKDLKLQKLVAQSLGYLLDIYDEQEKPLAVIELCDNIHLRFAGHKTLLFKQLVARSLAAKANILLKFNKAKDALKLFDEIIARYKEIKEPSLQTTVNNTLTTAALISLLYEDITNTRLRIQEAEKANQETSLNFVVIAFIRFLIDELSLEELIDKTEKLAENTEFDRSFAPLKSFIKRLPAEKQMQATAAIEFFENHHDIGKFKDQVMNLI